MLVQTPYTTPDYQIARRWAPFHWQEVRPGIDTPGTWRWDLITPIDFDGDWATIGNWAAMDSHPLAPAVYFSVVEAEAYWFVLYAYYHPRDWVLSQAPFDQHENDLEGALVVVLKPGFAGPEYPEGFCLGLITLAHNHFYNYSNREEDDTDGNLFFEMSPADGKRHPCTWQEAEGHGCFGLRPSDLSLWRQHDRTTFVDRVRRAFDFRYRKGVRYYHDPGATALEPAGYGRVGVHDYPYVLVDIFEPDGMWLRRCGPRHQPYAESGKFAGLEHNPDAASPPWKWTDKDHSSELGEGIIATDPALLVAHYFSDLPSPLGSSTPYIRNPYADPLPCESDGQPGRRRRGTGPAIASARGGAAGTREIDALLLRMVDPVRREDARREAASRARTDAGFRRALVKRAQELLEKAMAQPGAAGGRSPATELHHAIPAIYVMAELGEKSARPTLVDLLESSSDRTVLVGVCEALERLSPSNEPGFKEALVIRLSHGDWRVREAAARLYSRTLARRDSEPLLDLLADPRSSVRIAAIEGVGRGATRKGLNRLRQLADDDTEPLEVQLAAETAAGARGRRRGPAIAGTAAGDGTLGPGADTPASPEEWARIRRAQVAAESS